MRVQTLGGLALIPRSFAPNMFRDTATGIAIPHAMQPGPYRHRGIRGLGEAGLSESIGLLTLGGVVGGAIGFVIGAAAIAWVGRPRSRW